MKKYYALLLCMIALYFGTYNGYVALLHADTTTPEIIFPYHISIYPEADQQKLKHGIPIENDLEMTKFLEDYFS